MANTFTHRFETVVLGQGLAGSTLAWKLHERGESVLLVDRGDESSSSQIAAGLLTPITGQRLTRYPNWGQYFSAAKKFYQFVEKQTGETFFSESPMVRIFASSEERELFLKKYRDADDVRTCEVSTLPKVISSSFGGFEMLTAARLDTKSYLAATQSYFETQGGYRQTTLSLPEDLQIESDRISLPRLNVECNRVIFCQGFEATENPWFRDVPFDAAKGEILTLKVSDWEESRVVHAGLWVAPEKNDRVRIGATYEREQLDQCPTDAGRTDLLERWNQVQKIPSEAEIVEHRAAVRPVIHGRSPRMGVHPKDARLGFMNGLGSRGALLSPVLADQMTGLLREGIAVDNKYDLHQKVNLS